MKLLVGVVLIACCQAGAPAWCATPHAAAAAASCSTYTVGIDTSLATTSAGDILGEAVGESFFAQDTLLASLTVWRVASECAFGGGIKLFITRTDSTGAPQVGQIVLDGPTLYVTACDGVHPTAVQWNFDPPLVLPGRGEYAFFLQIPPEQCPGYYDFIGREAVPDAYPQGQTWLTSRTAFSGCGLRSPVLSYPASDIIFTIAFCPTSLVPTRDSSWGAVKIRYR
jgi:hypothetical protein